MLFFSSYPPVCLFLRQGLSLVHWTLGEQPGLAGELGTASS